MGVKKPIYLYIFYIRNYMSILLKNKLIINKLSV